jgi:hypothetical protein
MSRIISIIPAKPRSNRFKYYNTSTSSGGFNMSSGSSISAPQNDNQEVAYIDTFNNIPNPPDDGLKLVITQDTHEIFSWDYDANQWVNTTPESDVTQII